jgi:Flp pilus assembly pilin Flp
VSPFAVLKDNNGAIAIETAFCLPLVTAALLAGFMLAQGCINWQRLENAACADANALAAGQSAAFVSQLGGSETSSCTGSCTPLAAGATEFVSASLANCTAMFGHEFGCSASAEAVRP